MLACFACADSSQSHIALCGLGPGDEGTKFNGGAGPARAERVCGARARPPPSALVEGRRAPSSTCSACNKLVGQLPQSWPFALGRAGFSHHEGAVYRSTDLPRFLSCPGPPVTSKRPLSPKGDFDLPWVGARAGHL